MQVISSKLFSGLFQQELSERPVRVLDLAAASPETVAFFGQFRCKLFFADLFSEPDIPINDDELSDAELCQAYSAMLDFPVGAQFDVLLFWDFFHLLDRRSMRAFSEALAPYLADNCRGYGFGTLNRQVKMECLDFRIQGFDQLSTMPRNANGRRLHAHSQSDFDNLMQNMKVEKGILLQNGRLEILMSTPSRAAN